MNINLKKRKEQLGEHPSTAQNKLKKLILFDLIQKLGLDICYQCTHKIEELEDLSIEHKEPWLNSETPKELFFSLENIAFSHLKCNIGAARKKGYKHPSLKSYEIEGCRCNECKELQKLKRRNQRKRNKN